MTQIMNSLFKLIIILYLIIAFHVLNSCTQIRESAGVERKIPDEYSITKNPPLVLPPDYNLLPSEEIIARKTVSQDDALSKEILFGLGEELESEKESNTSSIIDSILEKSGANNVSDTIRDEIDSDFSKMLSSKSLFGKKYNYLDNEEILDAAKESKRLRDNIFNNESVLEGDIPITTKSLD